MEMKMAIKSAVEKVFRKLGMAELIQSHDEDVQPVEVQRLSRRISKSSRMSIRDMNGHGPPRKSLLEELAEVRRLHESVVISV